MTHISLSDVYLSPLPSRPAASRGTWGCAACSKPHLQPASPCCPPAARNPGAGRSPRPFPCCPAAAGSRRPLSAPCSSGRLGGSAESPGRPPTGRRSCRTGATGARPGCPRSLGSRATRDLTPLRMCQTAPPPWWNGGHAQASSCTEGCQSLEVVAGLETEVKVEAPRRRAGRACELTSSSEQAVECHRRRISSGVETNLSSTAGK